MTAVLELLSLDVAGPAPFRRVSPRPGWDCGLLVDAQDEGVVAGMVQVETTHVDRPFGEVGVVGAGQPTTHEVRFEIQIGEDPPDLRRRDPDLGECFGDQPMRPLRLHLRRARRHRLDDLQPFVVPVGTWPAAARPIVQPGETSGLETATPHTDLMLIDPNPLERSDATAPHQQQPAQSGNV